MFQSIRQIAEKISALIAERPFSCGFLTGLAAALALLLFFLLLGLIFRPRKLRYVMIRSEGGDLRIDAKAVRGAVRSVAEKFPAFRVRHVALFGKQTAVELEIAMDFNGGDVSVSDTAAQFRSAISRMMTDTFGMEKPARIELEILRSGADIPAEGEPEPADADFPLESPGPQEDPAGDAPGITAKPDTAAPSATEPGQSC